MKDVLPFLIIGLTSGSVYGLAGTGLVLTYKTSGIFNFAHGSVAAMAVFVFYYLHVQHHLPWPLAGAICVHDPDRSVSDEGDLLAIRRPSG